MSLYSEDAKYRGKDERDCAITLLFAMISDEVRAVIAKHDQSHILKYYDAGTLSEEEKASFEKQISLIDFDRLQKIYDVSVSQTAASSADAQLDPIESITDVEKLTDEEKKELEGIAFSAICNGEVGIMLMAGGQGTRLGCSFPKGQYDIDLLSHKSLFQLQAERIRRIEEMAYEKCGKKCTIPWYVMTSPMTHTDTLTFFTNHQFFGLQPTQVIFFSQGTLPCMDDNGHIILTSPSQIATAPDGNGGLYMALYKSLVTINNQERSDINIMDHLTQQGVKYLQIYGVDNAIVRIPDPVMFGLFIKEGNDAGNKCVAKNGPHERVGVVCKKEGAYNVVEYSELSEVVANMRNEEGELVFSAGFICNLYYTVDFLRTKCCPENLPLLYHIAHKAIPYYDEESQSLVKPKQPNGVKMESFIFDVFPFSKKMGCLMVPRSEFTPVKNANEAKFDCPDSARQIMTDTFVDWLKKRNVELEGTIDSHCLEISGLVSFAGENLERLSNQKIQLPCFICKKNEVSEEELKEAEPFCENVLCLKKEFNKYIFI